MPNLAGDTASYSTASGTLALDTLTLDADQTIGALINKNTGALTIASDGTHVLTMDGTGLAAGALYANAFSVGASQAGTAFIGRTTTATTGALTVNTAISMNSNLNIGAVVSASAITIGGAITNGSGSAKTLTFFNAGAAVNDTAAIGASGSNIAIATSGTSSSTITLSGNLGPSVTTVTSNSNNNGVLTLSGTNTYTGATILTLGRINAHDIETNNFIKALSTSQVTLSSNTLSLKANGSGNNQTIITGDGVTGNNVVVNGNTTINVDRFGGTNTGSTIQLNNLTIGANTLTVTSGNRYAVQFAGTTTLTNNATFNTGANALVTLPTLTLTGAINDGGNAFGFTKSGAGILVLNGNNTFTGLTTVSAGTLATSSTGTFGAGNVTVAPGTTLTFGNNASIGDLATLTFASTSNIGLSFTGVETLGAVFNSVTSTFLTAGTYDASQLNTFFGGSAFTGTGSLSIGAIPEPSTYTALAGALTLSLAVVRRRRQA
ncbi:MAG: autotransporter-associated beta strand repeat-containing protein [Opitutaceae bacterium]|nr:autotransporter-associated beta strand repeat-containing protein [Opitutaceae bacterium]